MRGRAWKFGDDINTDTIAPGLYMKSPIEELATHCLEAVDESFASNVSPGDIVVAGRNFGAGSSREQAAQILALLGVGAVVAKSFGGIFYRNAFNLGLMAVVSPDTDRICRGDDLELDPESGRLRDLTTGEDLRCETVPPHLVAIVRDGGLVPHLERTLTTSTTSRSGR